MAAESERAAVWEINPDTGAHRIYASGLRNPVGLAWEPQTGVLWTAVNERDELGDQLPPDYMTGLHDGAFYGWPFSYYGQHVDARAKPQNPELVAKAIAPDYALGAHTASLGLCWSDGRDAARAISGMACSSANMDHGTASSTAATRWCSCRSPTASLPARPIDVLTGFLNAKDEALGRPVGVAIDARGALLVADDVGGVVWRVSATSH